MEHPSALLRQLEARARKRFGQHFLAADGVVRRIVSAAGVGEGSRVVEVGPGLGVLTEALLDAGAHVVAVELDRDLAAFLRERFAGRDLVLVEADAARTDWPALLPGDGWACVSNLPYNVGTGIVTDMLRHPLTFHRLVVMLQKEVCERLLAPPGDRGRGSLSVYAQAHADVRLVLRVKPGAFHPPPKIDSAVVELILRRSLEPAGVDPDRFEQVVRAVFTAPRKTLRNNLTATWGREEADRVLGVAGVDPSARPAVLTVDELAALAHALEA